VKGRCGGEIDFRSRPGETVFRVGLLAEDAEKCERPTS
jgi:hypothetical protein